MNLLSHFVCAEPLTPAGKMGAMAPDLLPLYHRKIRVFGLLNNRPPLPEGETLGPLMEDFLAG
ncbi:MAG: hypothetical protein OEW12_08090, partial [Deltaproteobacteria bacterium]|nr:hypothetical protein [Deltaproteobacteria bacterium]